MKSKIKITKGEEELLLCISKLIEEGDWIPRLTTKGPNVPCVTQEKLIDTHYKIFHTLMPILIPAKLVRMEQRGLIHIRPNPLNIKEKAIILAEYSIETLFKNGL